jgi:hypothetical protein
MPAPDAINAIVERYRFHRDAYLRGQEKYNEAQLRQDFIDPFFRALGWDVNNNKGFSEAYREVLHGEPVRVRGTTQFFDYTFRIGGLRKFIVETKKPSVRIKDDADAALQIRWYAWNAKLPLSILTNFEEFAIYDCTRKPSTSDAAAVARIEYFTYKEFLDKWEYIQSIFAQESILTGSFDKFAESTKGKHGTAGVDDAFLQEIEEWRDTLARNFALRNPTLSVEELNAVVQRTIDRIVFLRICEDRGIEDYKTLFNLMEGEHVYERLCTIFRNADGKYNSGLFHFQQEPDWDELPDTLSLSLSLDDKVLKGIIKRLYYPDSPYLFSVIPPVILGNVYEQFLGKVIRLTEGHQAKVEYKPEVKKAHGVYYTPEYIVSYIVRHTVGELLKDKNPREVSKIRILDPACGSGSFLLGAFQYLLDWHRDWYIANLVPVFKEKNSVTDPAVQALLPEPTPKKKKAVAQVDLPIYKAGSNGDASRMRSDWRLTTAEKKRILLNNLFGVDIDQMAVEVTKLSLLLKVLEEENEENISKQLKLFAERALPSLHQNIKCGNSLIGTDILTPEMPIEEVKRINPFDWEREFSDVMKAGGFDAVIGNPPWGADFSTIDQENIRKRFKVASGRNLDSYAIFIEAGLKKLRKGGLLSYITPDTFLRKDDHYELRFLLLNEYAINELIETGPVFSKVRDTWALVFLLSNQKPQQNSKIFHKNLSRFIVSAEERLERFRLERWDNNSIVSQELWKNRPYCIFGYLASEKDQSIIAKIEVNTRLGESSDVYSISRGEEGSKFLLKEIVDGNFFMVIPNDVGRYTIEQGLKISEKTLTPNKVANFYQHPKIWAIRIQKMRWKQRLVCTLDERSNSAGMKTLQVIVSTKDDVQNLLFLQGILSSTLMNYYLVNYLADDMNKSYLEKIPIRTINFSDPPDKARHDRMVALVTQMLDLNKKLQDARLEQEKTMLSRQIEATDASIDKLVYELYGLTEEEIAVVEENEER